MKWIASVLLMSCFSVSAEVAPEHVESMLQQMVRENVISPVEAEKAKIRMRSMSPEQWKEINHKAQNLASRMPASTVTSENKIEEVNSIDLDGAQFKAIQSEMKKIIPEFRDHD